MDVEVVVVFIEEFFVIVWFVYVVYGNEILIFDVVVMMVYYFLVVQNDLVVDNIFENMIVFIDLLQNLDGCDCFVYYYCSICSVDLVVDCILVEYDELWLGGCINYYFFDFNCDWFVLIQFEIQVCIEIFCCWFLQVFVDLYEMGGDLIYYFVLEVVFYNLYLVVG